MAKAKTTAFFCSECGYESSKWMGQCPACKAWNTLVEEPTAGSARSASPSGRLSAVSGIGAGKREKAALLSEISLEEEDRISTGFKELDRVLGDGIVAGSLILVGGDPGIGKSTLLLQVCRQLAADGKKVLYISGEESLKQIKMRACRIGSVTGDLRFLCETNLDHPDYVPGGDFLCSRKRQPGKRIHRPFDADCKEPGHCHLCSRPCDKGGGGGRP